MKNNIYQNAVDHLEFSDSLCEKVMETARKPRSGYRVIRIAAVAALMVCLLAISAFAVSPEFRDWTVSILKLGVSRGEMTDAVKMEFNHEEVADGVTMHYLELDKNNYEFAHSMLMNPQSGFLRITEDYRLEPIELIPVNENLVKNGRTYTRIGNFSYYETEQGIISWQRDVLQKNESGEVFLNFTDGNSSQWPVYLNLETGAVRDALPGWTADDFEGRVAYSYELMGGILVSTIVNDGKTVNGKDAAYNMLYWIGPKAEKAEIIELPKEAYGWYCENNMLFYRDGYGSLYQLNENLEFDMLCSYATGDDLTHGLYTVATDEGKLAIFDAYSGDFYVISECTVDPGISTGVREREGGEIDETMGYNAIRYNADGKIALVQTDWIPEEERVALLMLGILDEETGKLKLLEIENGYDGYTIHWLDANRLAVIYDELYLCIYEFE